MHPTLSTPASVDAAWRYLRRHGALDRDTSMLFSDPRHANALRIRDAARSVRWSVYHAAGTVRLRDRLRTWWRSLR